MRCKLTISSLLLSLAIFLSLLIGGCSETASKSSKTLNEKPILAANYDQTLLLHTDGTVSITSSYEYSNFVHHCDNAKYITAGSNSFAVLADDGECIFSQGYSFDSYTQTSDSWENIKKYEVGSDFIIALRKDGKVLADGENLYGQCNTQSWGNNVADISAGDFHSVALMKDGTVKAKGKNDKGQCNTNYWNHITSISAGYEHTVALKKDGTVVAVGDNCYGQCDVGNWNDIIAISAGAYHTLGLKSNGTVVAVGDNKFGQCNVSNWSNIDQICAGDYHSVAMDKKENLFATGKNHEGQCNVEKLSKNYNGAYSANNYTAPVADDWNNIVDIAVGNSYIAALKKDGSVISSGLDSSVSTWTNVKYLSPGHRDLWAITNDNSVLSTQNNRYFDSLTDVKLVSNSQDGGITILLNNGDVFKTNYTSIEKEHSNIITISGGTFGCGCLTENGVVLSNYHVYDNKYFDSNVIDIDIGCDHLLGLYSNGKVEQRGSFRDSSVQNNVHEWTDITAIAAGHNHSVGLKSDGTVVATGDNSNGQCNVSDWTNIVKIGAGNKFTVGLTKDGRLRIAAKDYSNFENVGFVKNK